jgi:hypothetical protein
MHSMAVSQSRNVGDRLWPTDELHVAKLLAVKQPVATVSSWPGGADEFTFI